MKRYRCLLDGNILNDDPIGWDKFKQRIHTVPELNARLLKIDVSLIFHGDGFDYLLTQYNTLGHCGLVDFEWQELNNDLQTYRRVHTGYIFISDISIDRKEMQISSQVEDNSFYARINNNKNIETFVWGERTKNNVVIPEAVASTVTYVDPDCVTTYTSPQFAHYRVFDLFTYLVSFCTDANVDFVSDLFDVGGDFDGLMVTCGAAIRLTPLGLQEVSFQANFQKLSFQKLFTEVNKKIHIGMRIEVSGGRPRVRIERDSYFRQTTVMHTCANIDRVTESIEKEKLYAKIKLGSTKTDNALSLSFPEDITLLGFKQEEFIILGECNLDKELNLVSDFIVSSNIIEDCLLNAATSYDTDFFFVMTEPLYANYITKMGNVFGDPSPCQYNLDLTNVNVTQNWLSGIPNSMAQYFGDPLDLFKAQTTIVRPLLPFASSVATQEPIVYNDDSSTGFFDVNGDYNAVAFFDFTSPVSGSYSFRVKSFINMQKSAQAIAAQTPIQVSVTAKVQVYDSGGFLGGNLISSTSVELFNVTLGPTASSGFATPDWFTPAIFMQTGYRADIRIDSVNLSWNGNVDHAIKIDLNPGSFWQCIGSQQGGIVQGIDLADYPVIQHEFEQELTPDEFDAINADSRGLVSCTTHRDYRFQAWLKELEFDRANGMAKFKLYSTKNLNG